MQGLGVDLGTTWTAAAVFDGSAIAPQTMAVLTAEQTARVAAQDAARYVIIGGDALDGPRFIWWNFVSISRERIERAKHDWAHGKFDAVPGETEFIPLPEK